MEEHMEKPPRVQSVVSSDFDQSFLEIIPMNVNTQNPLN